MKDAFGEKVCETCKHWHNPTSPDYGACVKHPPTCFITGVQPVGGPLLDPTKAPRMAHTVSAYFPPMQKGEGCHEHELNAKGLN